MLKKRDKAAILFAIDPYYGRLSRIARIQVSGARDAEEPRKPKPKNPQIPSPDLTLTVSWLGNTVVTHLWVL